MMPLNSDSGVCMCVSKCCRGIAPMRGAPGPPPAAASQRTTPVPCEDTDMIWTISPIGPLGARRAGSRKTKTRKLSATLHLLVSVEGPSCSGRCVWGEQSDVDMGAKACNKLGIRGLRVCLCGRGCVWASVL